MTKCGAVLQARLIGVCLLAVTPAPLHAQERQDEFTETEPNDILTEAMDLGLLGPGVHRIAQGSIGNGAMQGRDVDLFKLRLAENDLPARLVVESLETRGVDAYLRVFDAQGYQLAANDDFAYPAPDARTQTVLLTTADYYVGFSDMRTSGYNPQSRYVRVIGPDDGEYELQITIESLAPPVSAYEPNDSFDAATPLDGRSVVIAGEFIGDGAHGARDVDVYRLAVTESSIVTATVRVDPYGEVLDPMIRIVPAARSPGAWPHSQTMGFSDDASCHDVSARARLATFGVEGKIDPAVLVIVSGAPNGLYDLDASGGGQPGSTGTYDLIIEVEPLNVESERIFDDAPNPASSVALVPEEKVTLEGRIGDGFFATTKGDADFYTVDASEWGVLEVDVDAAVNGSELDSFLSAFYDGNLRIAQNDNDGVTTDSLLFVSIPCYDAERHGPYYRQVHVSVTGVGRRVEPSHVNALFLPSPVLPFTRPARHEVREQTGSTGAYQIHFTLRGAAVCSEPNSPLEPTDTGIIDEGLHVCTAFFGTEPGNPCPAGQDRDAWAFAVRNPPVLLEVAHTTCDDVSGRRCLELYRGNDLVLRWEASASHELIQRESAVLTEPGDYRLLLTGLCSRGPEQPCVTVGGEGAYGLSLRLVPLPVPLRSNTATAPGAPRVFASLLDPEAPAIVELHPTTGEIVNGFTPPETFYGIGEGLAFDGEFLYYLGSDQYPHVYRLDPDDGSLIDARVLWVGSGYYTDILARGDELLVLDALEHALYAFPLDLARSGRRLDPLSASRMALQGGLAATSANGSIVGLDGFWNERIYRMDGTSAQVGATIEPVGACRCLADLDNDGDVDADDRAQFDACLDGEGPPIRFGCTGADLDCDADVDDADAAILECQFNGPGRPPNEGCCPPDLPRAALRVTELGGGQTGVIAAADWMSNEIRLLSRDGCAFQTWNLPWPVGAVTGSPVGRLGDIDLDGDIGLADYTSFSACQSGPGVDPGAECTRAFDFDDDLDVDLHDFREFQLRFTGDLR